MLVGAYPQRACFELSGLQDLIQGFLTPGAGDSSDDVAVRGVFRTRRGWLEIVGRSGQLQWQPIAYRRDSQIWISGEAIGAESIATLRKGLDALSGVLGLGALGLAGAQCLSASM